MITEEEFSLDNIERINLYRIKRYILELMRSYTLDFDIYEDNIDKGFYISDFEIRVYLPVREFQKIEHEFNVLKKNMKLVLDLY